METPASYKEAGHWKPAQPSDNVPRGNWWEIYRDPELNALMAQLDAANPSIQVAEAQYRQARALAQQARSAFFPTIGASASTTRSGGRGGVSSNNGVSAGGVSNSYNLSLDASWEPDLWGSIRRSVEAGNAGAAASEASLANARLSAQSELAQDYFQLRVTDQIQALLDQTVSDYEKSLQLTKNQYAVGVAQRSDVLQAQTQLQSAQAAAVDNRVTRAQFEHAIAVLIGKPPASFTLAPAPLRAVLPDIPVGLPSELLERRPDIAAAERLVAQANAKIGVAEAAFFPTLTLSAAGGFQSNSFANWLTLPSRVWSIGPQLAATLFDAGLRRAQTQQAVAAYDQQVATYRQTVLGAFQEVEDNLAALNYLAREAVLQNDAVASAKETVGLVLNQYKAGTVSYLNVVVAQATAYTNERTALQVMGRQFSASVLLVAALGGGWDAAKDMQGDGGAAPRTPAGGAPEAASAPSAERG